MASSVPRSTTSEPDSLFPAQDDGLPPTFVPAYQQPRHFSYPMFPAHTETVPFSIASSVPLNMYSQAPTFDFITTAPPTQTNFWPSPPLSVGPEQSCFDAISSSTLSPSQTVPVAFQFGLSLGQEPPTPMPTFTSTGAFGAPSSSDISRASDNSRASSPGNTDLKTYGYQNPSGTWSCAYPGCTSKAVFTRGCDLRKHHKRHTKSFFCRYPNCTQSSGGGFSSKKDLARHEAKHNPTVVCEWQGCERVFSRVDNMVSGAIFSHKATVFIEMASNKDFREIMSRGFISKPHGVFRCNEQTQTDLACLRRWPARAAWTHKEL